MVAPYSFQVSVDRRVTVVQIDQAHPQLREVEVEHLTDALVNTVQNADPKWILIELSHVEFFGSSFIELLLRIASRVQAADGKFALAGLTSYCREVLEVTHLDQLWKIYPTADDAVAAMSKE